MTQSLYDLIIVGGGIAGLRVGIETLKLYPGIRCCILEKYGYIGGRVVTFKRNIPTIGNVQWENGAGRISVTHKKVLQLFSKYHLTFIPNSPDTDFIQTNRNYITEPTGNIFTKLINVYLSPISSLPKSILMKNTLVQILDMILGKDKSREFYEQFPYFSEMHVLRADIAIESFKHEMKSNNGFGSCKEGLSTLIDNMMNEYIALGGTILMDTEVLSIINNTDNTINIECNITPINKNITYTSTSVVLALHHSAVKTIKGVNKIPVLNHLKMTPLLRMYAVFPVKNNVSWFTGLNRIVTNSSIRYIIPINPKKGIIMISYTDGDDAKYWIDQHSGKYSDENIEDLVMTEIRTLFPHRTVPDPLYFKLHPWYDGCTYWLPGNYSIEDESNKSIQPLKVDIPNLFMCGESFAVNQCWMESALDQADKLINNSCFRDILGTLKVKKGSKQ